VRDRGSARVDLLPAPIEFLDLVGLDNDGITVERCQFRHEFRDRHTEFGCAAL
jgi:hypothetical protein